MYFVLLRSSERKLKEQHNLSETIDFLKCWTGNSGKQPQEMPFSMCSPISSRRSWMLTVLASAAAPSAMRTPTLTHPDVAILAVFMEFQELRGTGSVLR